jgi:hypothetical protein
MCGIRDNLPAHDTKLKLRTEAVDIRALGAHDLHKRVDQSDNINNNYYYLFIYLTASRPVAVVIMRIHICEIRI